MENDKWLFQIRKGLVELAVMILMEKKAVYGYEMTKSLKPYPLFELADGSIYPLLKRLEKNNWVETYWDNPEEGVRRKYYKLSIEGQKTLQERLKIFQSSTDLLLSLKGEVENEE
ncbi:Transcriptional regulator, PadR-like family protein [Planococcus antarcticus DSM 14505]|uniref:Transcriptional regulator, PadR-like family protein n=1 Tax=Planococcus antarcticus DSM 14505 TaxID=1185653 RepID=A0AA87IRJ9_9BACL|nr:PadR family transcriptional regulator [Planococcus antarcticus]EIM08423.1 Transcriptional regulator, PadR-like family protein [Planococcus antarcticus DSM 14505]